MPRADSLQCIASRSSSHLPAVLPGKSNSLGMVDTPPIAHVGLYCWMSMSIAWSSRCVFGITYNRVHSSGVTCITSCWENAMILPIFQVPSCTAFRSRNTWLFSFSSSSRQWPQFATGVQVLSFSGCCCRSKVAMPRLDALVFICSLAQRSALSQCGTVTTHCTTSQMHSPAAIIQSWVCWPKSWHNGLTNSVKARTYSL